MNYYQPRQVAPDSDREDSGKWRYTCRNDDQIWLVGNCRECPGHDTPEEAREHQREYELDRASYHEGEAVEQAHTRHECGVCEALTTSWAYVGPGIAFPVNLCTEHLNREGLASAWDGPGDVASS